VAVANAAFAADDGLAESRGRDEPRADIGMADRVDAFVEEGRGVDVGGLIGAGCSGIGEAGWDVRLPHSGGLVPELRWTALIVLGLIAISRPVVHEMAKFFTENAPLVVCGFGWPLRIYSSDHGNILVIVAIPRLVARKVVLQPLIDDI